MPIRTLISILAAGLACLCMGGTSAAAAAPLSGSGTFQVTFVPTGVQTADGNTFLTFTFVETSTGFLAGTRVGQGSLVIHPDGTLTARTEGLFTGTIGESAPGTVNLKGEVSGSFAAATGQVQASDGAGGLTGVLAKFVYSGHATGPTSLAGTLTGQAQFVTS